jgi:hypothetical protein
LPGFGREVSALQLEIPMRKPLLLSALLSLFLVPAAQAAMPQFQASCGGMIETHDEDGTVYINGKLAKLEQQGDTYTATLGHTSVTIRVRPNGTPDVTYTARHRGGDCNLIR